jgi:hypothetical protein
VFLNKDFSFFLTAINTSNRKLRSLRTTVTQLKIFSRFLVK